MVGSNDPPDSVYLSALLGNIIFSDFKIFATLRSPIDIPLQPEEKLSLGKLVEKYKKKYNKEVKLNEGKTR